MASTNPHLTALIEKATSLKKTVEHDIFRPVLRGEIFDDHLPRLSEQEKIEARLALTNLGLFDSLLSF